MSELVAHRIKLREMPHNDRSAADGKRLRVILRGCHRAIDTAAVSGGRIDDAKRQLGRALDVAIMICIESEEVETGVDQRLHDPADPDEIYLGVIPSGICRSDRVV